MFFLGRAAPRKTYVKSHVRFSVYSVFPRDNPNVDILFAGSDHGKINEGWETTERIAADSFLWGRVRPRKRIYALWRCSFFSKVRPYRLTLTKVCARLAQCIYTRT